MHEPNDALTRRGLLRGAAAAGAAALAGVSPHALAAEDKAAMKGRIKQSIVFWCFNGRRQMGHAKRPARWPRSWAASPSS